MRKYNNRASLGKKEFLDLRLGLHGGVASVVGSDHMLGLRLEGTLEEVFADVEHLVYEILWEAVVLEVEEADVLGSIAELTVILLGVGCEEAEIDHRDSNISAGEGVGSGILHHFRWKEEGGRKQLLKRKEWIERKKGV